MTQTVPLPLDALLALIQPDLRALADGHRRMVDILSNRPTDSLPIIFSAPPPEGAVAGDMHRHAEDAEQMFYDLSIGLVAQARSGSDAQLTLRVNTGTGTLATLAGCALIPSEFALPWTTHLTREQLEAFDPMAIDLSASGIMPRVREFYAYFRERLPECVHFFCADTQGPFDLAHVLYGNDLFYDVYDDPGFAHSLLEKATYLYIEGTRLMKSWIGESLDGGHHWAVALANGGVRACEDTSTLLSPELIEEFTLPYLHRALDAFGGGFVHYCGNNDALYASMLRSPVVRALNFGNPERYDFSVVIPQLIEAGKCYLGDVTRFADETLEDYFRRLISYTGGARKGLILFPQLRGEENTEPQRVVELWRSLQ